MTKVPNRLINRLATLDPDRAAAMLVEAGHDLDKVMPRLRDARIAMGLEAGHIPPECGDEMRSGPARAQLISFMPRATLPKGADGFEVCDVGRDRRHAARVADAIDVMRATARRFRRDDPFTPDQVQIARRYAALVERYDAGAVKTASLETVGGGSGGGGCITEARLAEKREIDSLRARIGDGVALSVRRQRPSTRPGGRLITDRQLVDAVCLGGKVISAVLRDAGWVKLGGGVSDRHSGALMSALCAALDRMTGPVGGAGRVLSARFGGPPIHPFHDAV